MAMELGVLSKGTTMVLLLLTNLKMSSTTFPKGLAGLCCIGMEERLGKYIESFLNIVVQIWHLPFLDILGASKILSLGSQVPQLLLLVDFQISWVF